VLVVWCHSNVTTVVQLGSCVLGLALRVWVSRVWVVVGATFCNLWVAQIVFLQRSPQPALGGGGKVCSAVQYSVKGNSVLLGGQQ
jgi:hypothetical protein